MNMYAIEQYGYPIIFLNILLESFGFPLPGEITLTVSSALAGEGELNIVLVLVLAFTAAVIGDNIGYILGRLGGRALVLRFGKYIFLSDQRFRKLERLFEHYGQEIVLAARFISGLRQLNGVIAGTFNMHWKKFVLYNAVGAALWVAAWGSLAYILGRHTHNIYEVFRRLELAGMLVLLAGALLFLARHILRRNKRRER
jgi:membrane protein DedA with SNARE-associated domain